jgi:hypothetical protein
VATAAAVVAPTNRQQGGGAHSLEPRDDMYTDSWMARSQQLITKLKNPSIIASFTDFDYENKSAN